MPSTVTFECKLNKEDVEVEWYKDSTLLKSSKKYKMEAKGAIYKLTVSDVNDEDDGEFMFKVKGKDVKCKSGLFVEGE
jgi:hypothetical protein